MRVGLEDATTDGETEFVMDGALEVALVGVAVGTPVEGCAEMSSVGPDVDGLSVVGPGVMGAAVVGAGVLGIGATVLGTGAGVLGTGAGVLGTGAGVGSGCVATGAGVDCGIVGALVVTATGATVGA